MLAMHTGGRGKEERDRSPVGIMTDTCSTDLLHGHLPKLRPTRRGECGSPRGVLWQGSAAPALFVLESDVHGGLELCLRPPRRSLRIEIVSGAAPSPRRGRLELRSRGFDCAGFSTPEYITNCQICLRARARPPRALAAAGHALAR